MIERNSNIGRRCTKSLEYFTFVLLQIALIIIRQAHSFSTIIPHYRIHDIIRRNELSYVSHIKNIKPRKASFFSSEGSGEYKEDFDDDYEENVGKYEIDDNQLDDREFKRKSIPSISDRDTKLQIEQQQRQIDMLMEMFKKQQRNAVVVNPQKLKSEDRITTTTTTTTRNTSENEFDFDQMYPPYNPDMIGDNGQEEELSDDILEEKQLGGFGPMNPANTQGLAPLKAMFFIDGTWLYYSLHRRNESRDPIVKKFGKGWQYRYRFDWGALPGIVCEELVKQEKTSGWSSTGNQSFGPGKIIRGMEIVRANVFTSYKKTTDPNGIRVRMFNEMADANYDIHMLESSSSGPEKCVDISLAVDMLHYATVPNAYDVAILLSGDKDFIPAMVRTRQKGRKVGVVSMRSGCNRALYEKPHVKDFDVVWIDDFLDKLLVPLPSDQIGEHIKTVYDRGLLSAFTITKVILDFIIRSPFEKVSSRDIGKYLKSVEIAGGANLLDDVKIGQGGLRRFLQDRMPTVFEVVDKLPHEIVSHDPNDKSYWVARKEGANQFLLEEAKRSEFTPEEKEFLKNYQSGGAYESGSEDDLYFYTLESNQFGVSDDPELTNLVDYHPTEIKPSSSQVDYSLLTVPKLKELCRERGLLVSGLKAALVQRLEEHDQIQQTQQRNEPSKTRDYLINLIKYYIVESGGYASSRDLGRFLASNRSSSKDSKSALQELKDSFGGVASFINQQSAVFTTTRENQDDRDPQNFSFGIGLRGNPDFSSIRRSDFVPPSQSQPSRQKSSIVVDPNVAEHLINLIQEYLRASGGEASSRNIGRYLAANSASGSNNNNNKDANRFTALKQLKQHYGGLQSFLAANEDKFEIIRGNFRDGQQLGDCEDPPSGLAFGVRMIKL